MGESENKSSESGILVWFVIIALIGVCTWTVIPNFIKARSGNQPHCIDRLRQIDAAIYEWALEKGKTNGAIFTDDDIKPYIKLDEKGNIPKCPQGGKYTYGKVGDNPQVSCSLSTATPPHTLP
jgi:hypothetical protein